MQGLTDILQSFHRKDEFIKLVSGVYCVNHVSGINPSGFCLVLQFSVFFKILLPSNLV